MLRYSDYGFIVKACVYDFYRRQKIFMPWRYKCPILGFALYMRDLRRLAQAKKYEILQLAHINHVHCIDYWNSIDLITESLEEKHLTLVISAVDGPEIYLIGDANFTKVNYNPYTLKKIYR